MMTAVDRGGGVGNPMPVTPGDAPILYTQVGCANSARVRLWLRERDVPL